MFQPRLTLEVLPLYDTTSSLLNSSGSRDDVVKMHMYDVRSNGDVTGIYFYISIPVIEYPPTLFRNDASKITLHIDPSQLVSYTSFVSSAPVDFGEWMCTPGNRTELVVGFACSTIGSTSSSGGVKRRR